MTPQLAVKILTTYLAGSDQAEPVDFNTAVKLGVEALAAILLWRNDRLYSHLTRLPSETDE